MSDQDKGSDPNGQNHSRLQRIKKKYDPTNFFHMNQNIRPR